MSTAGLRRSTLGASLLGVLCLLTVAAQAFAEARPFRVISGSQIQFVSDAPLERITGRSQSVTGTLQIDVANLAATRGTISVPINSIRTGLDLRDEHLRGPDWLDGGHHPNGTFEITSVEGATALTPNQTVRVTLHGNFSIHGVSRPVAASAQVRLIPASDELRGQGVTGDLIRGQASFTLNLPDFNISVNPLVRLKVSDSIRVNVTIRAST